MKRPKVISMTKDGAFSDGMSIIWHIGKHACTAKLYRKRDNKNKPRTRQYDVIPMDEYHANVSMFDKPTDMYIPATMYDIEDTFTERKIIVHGTVIEVLHSIYNAYQQPAMQNEIELANNQGFGSKWSKIVDQMSDLIFFEGWDYVEQNRTKKVYLRLGTLYDIDIM